MSNNFTHDKELNTRPGKAATSFGRLSKRVWSNKRLTLHTKLKVHHACVLSILLIGAETWTTYRKQELKLNSFRLRCLRFPWREMEDKITNLEILLRCNSTPLNSILKQRQIAVQRCRNRELKDSGIGPMHWQTVAEERPTWRTSLNGGSAIDIKAYQIH